LVEEQGLSSIGE
jgi:ribosome recycling factor